MTGDDEPRPADEPNDDLLAEFLRLADERKAREAEAHRRQQLVDDELERVRANEEAAERRARDVQRELNESALALAGRALASTAPDAGKKRDTKRAAGAPDTLYSRGEIKRVLLLWRNRASSPQQISQSSIARPGFSRTAVRRVIRLDEHGAFELGPRGGLMLLGINGEFRAAPKNVSLRVLERALGLEALG